MMIVKIEVWPGGVETAPREIGRMVIANLSNLAEISDYSVHIEQTETPRLHVPAIDTRVTVKTHPRRDGPWALVRRALDQACA
ncbi:hypothetical protein SAMN05518668_10164 [Sphingobium sp. YR657]|uniref:Uncharacterized protein n=2 Tax=Sphingomonadaceae TaxID=41297 RepID=K9CMM6_SPHYA|nr:hypothetical protein HMPREF9718_04526 [Sphingobium yanoikuyae ATCC 51230]SHL44707.1 hypothetical protein SAMN05518668_10164 [Sphingobium sp. YR657]